MTAFLHVPLATSQAPACTAIPNERVQLHQDVHSSSDNLHESRLSLLSQGAFQYIGVAGINTDQGAQFTGNAFTHVLKDHKINISIDGKDRALGNSFIERLWRSVKYEEIYLKEYRDVSNLKRSLIKYSHFYNTEQPHQSLENRTPVEFDRKDTELRGAASI